METFVYSCPDVKALKKVLEGEPEIDPETGLETTSDSRFREDSFTRLGFIFRDGKPYGIIGYIVYFKADADRTKTFTDQLAAVPGCAPVSPADKQKIVDAIEAEENSAAAGFGSMFG